jgi:methionyl-tRNA synthetase
MNLARTGNRYFTSMEPWHSRKTDPEKCANTLHVCLQTAGALSILFGPVLPDACKKLRADLGIPDPVFWSMAEPDLMQAGHSINAGDILFQKIDDAIIEKQIARLLQTDQDHHPPKTVFDPIAEPVDFSSFAGLDIRAGRIVKATAVSGSKKLLDLKVDIGVEIRRIISGIAEYYNAEDIIGQQVCVVANLKPKKIMGIESNGMILMAGNTDGKLHFVTTDSEPGSMVR